MRDTLLAMRLYASPVFLRENRYWLLGIIYAVLCFGMVLTIHFHAIDAKATPIALNLSVMAWWVTLLSAFSAINMQYWRQICSPTTYLLPRLRRAEYLAVHAVTMIAFVVLVIPPLMLGTKLLNTLAMEALALALWSGADQLGPSALRRKPRRLRLFVTRFLFVLLLLPQIQILVFRASWPFALALLFSSCAIAFHEYRFTEYRLDQTSARSWPVIKAPRLASLCVVPRAVLLWRPGFLPRIPVRESFLLDRPVTLLMLVFGSTLLFSALGPAFSVLMTQHAPRPGMFRHSLPATARQSLILTGIGLGLWMRERADWPFLLTLSPYGSKHALARAIFRLHLYKAGMAGLAAAFVMALALWLDERMSIIQSAETGLADAALLIGCSCLPAIAFLVPRFSKPSVINMLTMGSIVIVLQSSAHMMTDSLSPWRWLSPAVAVFATILICCFVPAALARQDWPLEPPR